ncbi:MAG: DEAD/DEAH box helicase family protein [Smithella sp.]
MPLTLRPYQQEAVDSLFNYFREKSGNPIIVAPTSAGKSLIIAEFIRRVMEYPNQRVLLLSHIKELLQQNSDELKKQWPGAPVGLYSAGLNKRDTMFPITVAGIQSVYKKAHLLNFIHLILIDECHYLSPNTASMYQQLINELKRYNPKIKVIGLSATPYRMKGGHLTQGKDRLFTDIAYDIKLTRLLEEGYICPLLSKSSHVQSDLSEVKLVAGEYNQQQMEQAINKDELTEKALDEVFRLASNRQCWMFFCAGVDHAIAVRDALRLRGVACETVTGDTPRDERDRILSDLKAGKLKAVTNVAVLTTGFNCPRVDLVVLLRATKSPGLLVQMVGRAMRLVGATLEESIRNGKADGLILDFCGNLSHHGPINLIDGRNIGKRKLKPIICPNCEEVNEPGSKECTVCGFKLTPLPFKACPVCFSKVPLNARVCDGVLENGNDCDHKFISARVHDHDVIPDDSPVIVDDNYRERHEVDNVTYSYHQPRDIGKRPTLKVEYQCGLRFFSEYIAIESEYGVAKMKAIRWWSARAGFSQCPSKVIEAVAMINKGLELMTPKAIEVVRNGKYWSVIGYDF